MILSNSNDIYGKAIEEHFGLVSGSTVRAKNVGRDILSGLKNLVGGELRSYTQLLNEGREQAIERMKQEAENRGANAILNVRFETSSVAQGAVEIYVYGTAVKISS